MFFLRDNLAFVFFTPRYSISREFLGTQLLSKIQSNPANHIAWNEDKNMFGAFFDTQLTRQTIYIFDQTGSFNFIGQRRNFVFCLLF